MARVLMAWECGGGLGHVTVINPLAERLVAQGHDVTLAAANLGAARKIVTDPRIRILPSACIYMPRVPGAFQRLDSFAHTINNSSLGNVDILDGLVSGWHSIFQLVKPDLLVCDHSPSALVAARQERGYKVALIGTGFCCPPPVSPFPCLKEGRSVAADSLRADERLVTGSVNEVARRRGLKPLDSLAQLYDHRALLSTIPALDHYANRVGEHKYFGYWSSSEGVSPHWPEGKGKRVFCYLRYSPAVENVMTFLAKAGNPAIAFISGTDARFRQRFSSRSLRIEAEPLDMRAALEECDAAVLNGGHGSSVLGLLMGKPILVLAVSEEQRLTGVRLASLNVGHWAVAKDGPRAVESLNRFLEKNALYRMAMNTRRIAGEYEAWRNPDTQADLVTAELLRV